MGDASSVRLAIAEESVFGTNPGAGFQLLRFNSETLRHQQRNIQSAEIDATRQPAGNIRVSINAVGDLTFEHSLTAPAASPGTGYDPVIEGVMMSDWSTIIALAAQDIDISGAAGGVFTLTDAATSGAFTAAVKGQWLKIGGWATNGTVYAHITTKTSNDIVVCEGVRSTGVAVTNETGGGTNTIAGSMIRIGTTKKSYTLEKQYTDLTTPEYSLGTGIRIGTWSQRLSAQAIFENTFGFLGKLHATTTSSGAGSPTAKWVTDRLEAVDHYKMKMLGAFTGISTERILECSFNLDNRLREEPELGIAGSADIGISTPILRGSLAVYMATGVLMREVEANTASKIAYRLDDGTRQQLITIPKVRWEEGPANAQGNDQSVIQRLNWVAEPDADGISFQIDRF